MLGKMSSAVISNGIIKPWIINKKQILPGASNFFDQDIKPEEVIVISQALGLPGELSDCYATWEIKSESLIW